MLAWYVRQVHLLDGRQRWLRTSGGPLVYGNLIAAALAAAAASRAEPLWYGCPVEVDTDAEEVAM